MTLLLISTLTQLKKLRAALVHKFNTEKYLKNNSLLVWFQAFLREAAENCALLGYYAKSSGNFLPTFRDKLSVLSSSVKKSKEIICFGFFIPKYGTDRLSRNVGNELPQLAAQWPRSQQFIFLVWPLLQTRRCAGLLLQLITVNDLHKLPRTPLPEGSARRRDFYLYDTKKSQETNIRAFSQCTWRGRI